MSYQTPSNGNIAPTYTERYGCTCERDCQTCIQGWHHNCSYGCEFGKVIR